MKRTAPAPIGQAERKTRIEKLCAAMDAAGVAATLIGPTASLKYFTGMSWHPSERFTGALIHKNGTVEYITPGFEKDKVAQIIGIPGDIHVWQEEESPYALIKSRLPNGVLAVDEQVALFTWLGFRGAFGNERLKGGGALIGSLRSRKSKAEIALMQYAKDMTLEVQRRAWKNLREGVRASEVGKFIDTEHRKMGGSGNIFCIVSFGEDTSLPHGGETDRVLKAGDAVLIDTGTSVDGYNSDITRSYVFGREPSKDYVRVWDAEKRAQAAAFEAARIGAPCASVDDAARASMAKEGFGPDYNMPGLPHRTGHGIGLDVHESPNLVRGDRTLLATGMCFSNEPMIVVPGKLGIRLEDHFYMDEKGPRWFTQPSFSAAEPFKGVEAVE
ncbi:MAG TPA: Xaa-Pro peptidase family protein [Rhizomicrobium sp.]|nr:Xaa-Pro peptidase family protein [Rhizomicrobium sp.]